MKIKDNCRTCCSYSPSRHRRRTFENEDNGINHYNVLFHPLFSFSITPPPLLHNCHYRGTTTLPSQTCDRIGPFHTQYKSYRYCPLSTNYKQQTSITICCQEVHRLSYGGGSEGILHRNARSSWMIFPLFRVRFRETVRVTSVMGPSHLKKEHLRTCVRNSPCRGSHLGLPNL